MINSTQLTPAAKFGILIAACLGVLGARFCWVTMNGAFWYQTFLGYYFVLTLLVICGILFTQTGFRNGWFSASFWLKHKHAVLAVTVVTVFLHIHEPHVMRVLYDEPTHALGSLVMHMDKRALIAGQSNYVGDAFILTQYYPSFRQYLFPLLISLLHDTTGFRLSNIFLVNILLTPVVLFSVYFLGYKLAGKLAGLASVALLGTFPLFAQVVTSGEYDVLNVGLIGILTLFTIAYANASPNDRKQWMNLSLATALLLAVARTESILYLFPWAAVTLCLWLRERRLELTGFALISPLFLAPNLMSNLIMVVTGKGTDAQMRKNGEAFFDIGYLPKHTGESIYYFFSPSHGSTSSVLLSALGLAGCIGLLVCVFGAIRHRRARANEVVMVLFMCSIIGIYAFILTNFWGSPIDGMAARFCLPLMFVFAVAAGWLLVQFQWLKARPAVILGGMVVYGILFASPTMSRGFNTYGLTVSRAEEWFLRYAESKDAKSTLFIAQSNVSYIAHRFASSGLDYLARSPSTFVRAEKACLYREIIVFQSLRPDPKTGTWISTTDNQLPANVLLETIEERIFAPNYKARISRLLGYKKPDGVFIGPSSDDPEVSIKNSFKDLSEWYTYRLSLYP